MKTQSCRLAALFLFTLLLTSCGTHEKVSENISENIFDNMPENTQEELTGEESKTEDAGFTGVEEKNKEENKAENKAEDQADGKTEAETGSKAEAEMENKTETEVQDKSQTESVGASVFDSASDSKDAFPTFSDIPDYVGEPYAVLHDNVPYFSEEALHAVSFESYSPRDTLGRCGTAYACLSTELMPTEKRGSIGSIKPSGWQTAKYDIVDGGYLYNRCHLVGYQLTGENANADNLITGTRYMNVEGMLPFENMTADYIKETENHVLYRVTPLYNGDELVARGVVMEAISAEDGGEDLSFCVFCYNVQPGITIDYLTGESALSENTTYDHPSEIERQDEPIFDTYVLNTNTKKIHRPSCSSVADIAKENREDFTGDIGEKIKDGYALCKKCKPS